MRLADTQIRAIKEAVHTHFGRSANVFLFGSRVDNKKCPSGGNQVARKIEAAKIESSIIECDSHLEKCKRARPLLQDTFPLSEDSFKALEENVIEHIDQFIYRFTKVQDSMGTRLLPSLYSYVEADDSPKPFLTILTRLEQLCILTSAEQWQFFRNLRNNLAHDYPESIGQTVDTLNTLNTEFEKFAEMYIQVRNYTAIIRKFSIIPLETNPFSLRIGTSVNRMCTLRRLKPFNSGTVSYNGKSCAGRISCAPGVGGNDLGPSWCTGIGTAYRIRSKTQ